ARQPRDIILREHFELHAIKPHQPARRAKPQIPVVRLDDRQHRALRQPVIHLPGVYAIRRQIRRAQPGSLQKQKNRNQYDRNAPLHIQGLYRNKPNSAMAGQTGDFTMRNRTRVVVTGWVVWTMRQFPMLVPSAHATQPPSFHWSITKASTRWPSGKNSRKRIKLNVTGCLKDKTISALVTPSSVAQYVSRRLSRIFSGAKRASWPRVLLADTMASRAKSSSKVSSIEWRKPNKARTSV